MIITYHLTAKRGKKELWSKRLHELEISIPSNHFRIRGVKPIRQPALVEMTAQLKDRRYECVMSDIEGGMIISYEQPKRRKKQ